MPLRGEITLDLAQHKILVVDDEADNLLVMQATLEMLHQATVVIASSYNEALEKLNTFQPSLIVTDLSMPKGDGYMLLKALRQRPDTAVVPVIALTAHAMHGDRERVLEAGFDEYISKPFEVTLIGEQIIGCLEKYTQRQTQPSGGSNEAR